MDFEYGCAITNKYSFLDENEVEDPSELLAHVSEQKGKQAKETSSAKPTKTVPSTKQTSNSKQQQSKDVKKQPLQQQTDNSVKSSNKSAGGDDGKKQRLQKQQGGATGQQQSQQPKEDKENNSNKNDRRFNNNATGFKGDRRENNDNQRPPRRNAPRPEGGFSNQDRPRRFREFGNDNVQNEEGEVNENSGFRRGAGSSTGVGFRGPRGQGFRNRRTNDSEKHREFDRHSGSEKTLLILFAKISLKNILNLKF
jgi:hypothetical protein